LDVKRWGSYEGRPTSKRNRRWTLKDRGKRAAVAAAAAIMVVALGGPAASDPTERTVTKPYSGAHGATAGQAYAFWSIGFEHQVFEPRARERSVVITIEDKSGLPTRGHVWWVAMMVTRSSSAQRANP
jgi:hypothetical protein